MGAALKGLAWDHRRCWGPLDASVADYSVSHPGVTISWNRRSLYEFGEGRLNEAARDYDLVIFDHPFVGELVRDRLFVPLDGYLTDELRREFEADSVGQSWDSYQADGRQWALPIDAAAQVAAYRPDLLYNYADQAPRTHESVLDLARRLRADDKWLGLPLVPTDAMCLILTGAAVAGHPVRLGEGIGMTAAVAAEVIDKLRAIAAVVHPESSSWNPIRCFEHMIHNDDVVYTPFAFGYVNYASRADAPRLAFTDIPASPPVGSLLGGAGIGVSAFSDYRDEAAAYALHLCGQAFQRSVYVREGGQPGSLAAWTDPEANRLTRGFFTDTLATLQGSYLRDTGAGFVDVFREGTQKALAAIKGDLEATDFADWLNRSAERVGSVKLDRSYA